MGFLISLLGFIDPISKITGQIADAFAKKVDAQTERERIEADQEIKTLEAKRAVLVAESSTPINALIRAWLVFPPSLYVAKIFVWDKVLGWGSTYDLSDNLWWIVFIIYAFYFLSSAPKWFRR